MNADRARRLAGVLAAAALALLAAACTSSGTPTSTPTSPTATPTASTPTPTPEPTPTLIRDDAVAAAKAVLVEYLALFNEISNDPNRDVAELEDVAGDRALAWSTYLITERRESGQRSTGTQVVAGLTVTDVVLAPEAEAEYPLVEMTACLDVSGTDILDQNDNSVVKPGRPDRALVDYVVTNVGWPDGQRWIVTRDHTQLTDSNPPEFVPCH